MHGNIHDILSLVIIFIFQIVDMCQKMWTHYHLKINDQQLTGWQWIFKFHIQHNISYVEVTRVSGTTNMFFYLMSTFGGVIHFHLTVSSEGTFTNMYNVGYVLKEYRIWLGIKNSCQK